jgi:hypothetical protein
VLHARYILLESAGSYLFGGETNLLFLRILPYVIEVDDVCMLKELQNVSLLLDSVLFLRREPP